VGIWKKAAPSQNHVAQIEPEDELFSMAPAEATQATIVDPSHSVDDEEVKPFVALDESLRSIEGAQFDRAHISSAANLTKGDPHTISESQKEKKEEAQDYEDRQYGKQNAFISQVHLDYAIDGPFDCSYYARNLVNCWSILIPNLTFYRQVSIRSVSRVQVVCPSIPSMSSR
jgi:hypothetical protein